MIPGFRMDTVPGGRAVVVTIEGEVPRGAVSQANEDLLDLLGGECRYLILDCSRMTGVSSQGLGLVVYFASTLKRKGGAMLMVPPPAEVMRRIGGEALRGLVRFVASVEEAIRQTAEAAGPGAAEPFGQASKSG
ncbi:MAG TPA: STAS domain-containing protein [Planctomycetota bacterium]|nr:STAS domain-containing protein [Planctomycetota bacterium]